LKTVRFLLHLGANLEHHSNDGSTPLHIAASQGCDWKTVDLLLDQGANIGEQDNEGRNPLDHALECIEGGHDVVYLLVRAAADQGKVALLPQRYNQVGSFILMHELRNGM
jgi:ankyrin repeat protein